MYGIYFIETRAYILYVFRLCSPSIAAAAESAGLVGPSIGRLVDSKPRQQLVQRQIEAVATARRRVRVWPKTEEAKREREREGRERKETEREDEFAVFVVFHRTIGRRH
jgi:hypothetical protein